MNEPKLTVHIVGPEIDEQDIRRWFACVDVEQARDTLNVCRGIMDNRLLAPPKRQRRSDAGKPRPSTQAQLIREETERDAEQIDLRELGR
jgi:hypothetical protein